MYILKGIEKNVLPAISGQKTNGKRMKNWLTILEFLYLFWIANEELAYIKHQVIPRVGTYFYYLGKGTQNDFMSLLAPAIPITLLFSSSIRNQILCKLSLGQITLHVCSVTLFSVFFAIEICGCDNAAVSISLAFR